MRSSSRRPARAQRIPADPLLDHLRKTIRRAADDTHAARAVARLMVEEVADICDFQLGDLRYLSARPRALRETFPGAAPRTGTLLFAGSGSPGIDPAWLKLILARSRIRHSLAVPIRSSRATLGTMTLYWRSKKPGRAACRIVEAAAGEIGQCLEPTVKADAPLRRASDGLTAGLMASGIPILLVRGKNHRVEVANDAFQRISGSVHMGKPLRASPGLHDLIERVRTTRGPACLAEVPAALLSGGPLGTPGVFSCAVEPVGGADGTVDRVLLVATDVTAYVEARAEVESARSRTEEALAESRRVLIMEQAARHEAESASNAKDDFLARVTHELGTPIATLRLWLGLLKDSDPLDDVTRERALAVIHESAATQSKLIEDLLDLSRGVNHKLRLAMAPTPLAELVASCASEFHPAAERAGVSLEILPIAAGLVRADPARLRQIVGNLLSNAIRFTPTGGHVRVGHLSGDGWLGFQVRDDGIGIPADSLHHVFSPFRQVERETVRSRGGLGLGLAIVRELTRLHGGEVEARSDGPGHGSTFEVRLPRLA